MSTTSIMIVRQSALGFILTGALIYSAQAAEVLRAYDAHPEETSVSGFSSGAFMATQFGVAHSASVKGIGTFAGGAYACAQIPKPGAARTNNLFTAYYYCINRKDPPALAPLTQRADIFSGDGRIDPLSNLNNKKFWMFTGYNDGSVKRNQHDVLYDFYSHYITNGNIGNAYFKTNSNAGHGVPTNNPSHQSCATTASPFLNNCGIDGAGLLLQHIYGKLNPKNTGTLTGNFIEFSQSEFAPTTANISMLSTGFAYVPAACANGGRCRVHVVFHGCQMSAQTIGMSFVRGAGYNEWADTNNMIVLYPQAMARTHNAAQTVFEDRNNLEGCWDYWGYNYQYEGNNKQNHATKNGAQIRTVKAMVDRLTAGYSNWSSAPSGSFNAPTGMTAADSSHNSVQLYWDPVGEAVGYNVYRAACSTCAYSKINGAIITGASYSDSGLSADTTYYYKTTAIRSGVESAFSATVSKATAAVPPACDLYRSNNFTHVDAFRYTGESRAFACYGFYACARGTGAFLGGNNTDTFTSLRKTRNGRFELGTCQ